MKEEANAKKNIEKVGQEQIHGLLFSEQLSWQAIIYDLINTEQLNPWDLDISLLSKKYLEKVRQLEEANFFISSKVLYAASWLLRLKSEILIDKDLQDLDNALFGKKEEKRYVQERIELDEEIPELVVKTPLPRFKKISLEELMSALGHAIKTENRRIKKVVLTKQQEYETSLSLPKKRINIQDKIREVEKKLGEIFKNREEKFPFTDLAGKESEERVATFIPLLHLDTQHKVWLEQTCHCDEIWILLKHLYEKQNAGLLESMKKEVEEELKKLRAQEKLELLESKTEETEEEIDEERENKLFGRRKSPQKESHLSNIDTEEELN